MCANRKAHFLHQERCWKYSLLEGTAEYVINVGNHGKFDAIQSIFEAEVSQEYGLKPVGVDVIQT